LIRGNKAKNGTISTKKNKNENVSCRACFSTPTMPRLKISNIKRGYGEV
jgi:hypothetical protein